VIRKPLPSAQLSAEFAETAARRIARQREFIAACDARDANLPWADEAQRRNRIALRMNFASLHGARL